MLFIAICITSSSFGQITESFDTLADGSYGDTEQTHAFDSGQWGSLACIINSASYTQQSFTVNQAANDLYLRITSVQNTDRLLLDDFELTGYTLGLDTPQHPVSLYPNPASSVVYVQGNELPEKVQLYTLNGQLINEYVSSKVIPVKDLKPEFYLVKIHTASQVVSRKLVVY